MAASVAAGRSGSVPAKADNDGPSRERLRIDIDGSGPSPGGRAVRRRRPLPGGRAVVGGLLVAASGVGLFAATGRSEHGPGQSYLVAAHPLAAGARLSVSDLSRQPIDLPPGLRARAFDNPAVLDGATLLSPLAAGELVQASGVVAKGTDSETREVTLTVERGRVAGGLAGGERVDLLATYGTGDEAYTLVVSRGALVVAVDRGRGGLGDSSPTVLTVGIDDPEEAMAIAHASQVAKVTPLRSTGVDAPAVTNGGFYDSDSYRPPDPSGANGLDASAPGAQSSEP